MIPGQSTASSDELAQAIFEHAARINQTAGMRELIALNCDFARKLTRSDRASLWLLKGGNEELLTYVADRSEPLHMRATEGLVGACITTGEAVVENDAQHNPLFCKAFDERSGYETKQVLCVPLWTESKLLGVLQLLNKDSGI